MQDFVVEIRAARTLHAISCNPLPLQSTVSIQRSAHACSIQNSKSDYTHLAAGLIKICATEKTGHQISHRLQFAQHRIKARLPI